MRNLKKILALVLALVMSMSLMATANAFTDDAAIDADYTEAVEVLDGIGVFKGYENADGTFTFKPDELITRQEVAAVMYRIASGDVKDLQDALYVEGADFTDVKATAWSAGYIGYCANGNIIVGNGDGTFGPTANVTGYQVLAMALRAIGYDKNGEFTGADWAKNVATTAESLGILKNVPETVQLSKPATRELVAELIFQTIAIAPMVEYTPAFGYQPVKVLFGTSTTLGYEQFYLKKVDGLNDVWGRPYHNWVKDGTATVYASIEDTPIKTYTDYVTPCQIAQDYPFSGLKTLPTYTNGIANDDSQALYAYDTATQLGGQGRATILYADRIVYIDTMLAQVTAVYNATYDAAKHQITPATITLKVWDADNAFTVITLSRKANYPYTVGQYVLVSAVQNDAGKVVVGANQYAVIQKAAESIMGAQSDIWVNTEKHVIGGVSYDDNNRLHLDQAGVEITNHTWYLDQVGNVIGATDITSTNYAVIKNVRWVVGAPGYAEVTLVDMDGNESTATLYSIDGHNAGWQAANNDALPNYIGQTHGNIAGTVANMADETLKNTAYQGYALYRIDTRMDGKVQLQGYQTGIQIVNNAKFSANASAILKSDDTVEKFVSSTTKYLVKGANNTYTPITGTEAMASYSTANLFYVDLNADSIADYVYIASGTKTSAQYGLIYVTTPAYTDGLTSSKGYDAMSVKLNGADATVKTHVDDTAILAELALNVNKLYLAEFHTTGAKIGYLKSVTLIDQANVQVGTSTTYVDYVSVLGTINGMTLVNSGDAASYRIDGVQTYVGPATNYSEITSAQGIWVVYTKGVYNTASAIYTGTKIDNSAAANAALAARIQAVLDAATFEDIALVDGDDAAAVAAFKADVLTKLAAAGITGVDADDISFLGIWAPKVGTNVGIHTIVTVGTGANAATAEKGGVYIDITNTVTGVTYAANIKAALEATKYVKANYTQAEVDAYVAAVVASVASTTNLTITSTLPASMTAGQIVNVTVTGTVNGVAVSTTAQVVVQA